MKSSNPQEQHGTQTLRVLIIAPSLKILGGQAVQANHLLQHLREESLFEVAFLPHNPQLKGALGLLQSMKYLRTIVTSLIYCVTLILRIPKYDIIHIFSASYFSFLLAPTPAILLSKWFGKKTILNYHSGEAEDHLRRWQRTAVPILKLADELVVPSQYLVEVFRRFGLQASAVANVIDVESFKFCERSPLLPRFLTNRNLYSLYNVACVLRAFKIIQQKFPEATLKVAGDGRQRTFLKDLAQELKLRNVEFLGHVAPDRMSELYDEAHIFLNGSNIDNLPGSILDSFASGLPVVTTSAGGITHMIAHERTGLLVPRNDWQGMAAAAVRLLESQELARSIARNAYEACTVYTWPAVREHWLSIYQRLSEPSVRFDGQVGHLASSLQ
jgi:glycosyltransferase involved in cell wall biosynthesis